MSPASISNVLPLLSSMDDFISSLDTEAMLGNASPLKPSVDIFRRSSIEDNLLESDAVVE